MFQKKRLLTVNEIADLLHIAPMTVYAMKAAKRLPFPYIKLGRSIRFDQTDVEAYLQQSKHAGGAQ